VDHREVRQERMETVKQEMQSRKSSKSSGGLSGAQFDEVADLFEMFDRNGDGCVDRTEFALMMKSLGLNLTDRELVMFFDSMDDSGDGQLELKEFSDFLSTVARPITIEEELKEAFSFFGPSSDVEDADIASKFVTKAGLAQVFKRMGEDITEDDFADMIAAVSDNATEIDFATFKRMCQTTPVMQPPRPGTGKMDMLL